MRPRLCGFTARGAGLGWRCGGFRAAIRSRGAAWIWCQMLPNSGAEVGQASACRVFLRVDPKPDRLKPVLPKRSIRERAQGNVDGNALVVGSCVMFNCDCRLVAHL